MIAAKGSTEGAQSEGYVAAALARLLEFGRWPQPETSSAAGPFGRLGLVLVLLRETRALSQSELAAAAKVGKSQLSKYESGKELPKFVVLARILDALEVTPLQLFYALELIESMAPAPKKEERTERPDLSRLFSAIPGSLEASFAQICLGALALYRAASLAETSPGGVPSGASA